MVVRMTINDIAREAGVSKATVSRVINGKPDVSEAVRNHVLSVMKHFDYHPNATAQSVGNRMNRTIALAIPSDLGVIITNSYYASLIGSILDTLYRNNFFMLFAHHSIDSYEELINSSRVDGFIILTSSRTRGEIVSLMERKDVPCVLTSVLPGHDQPSADIDNRQGGAIATRHLLDKGHRRIAYLYEDSFSSYVERGRGYEAALAERGVQLPEDYRIHIGHADYAGGYEATMRLLDRRERPTAVFCCNDFVAQGVIAACQERGLTLPRDMSVIGFDNNAFDERIVPTLTSVDQGVDKRGEMVAKMIIDYVSTGKRPPSVLVDAELVERASVCEPGGN